MIDDWSTDLFVPSFEGFEIDGLGVSLRSTADRVGRETIVTTYPRRSGAHVDDLGGVPRSSTWTILFFSHPGPTSHVARFQEFVALVSEGVIGELVHPLTGALTVKVGSVTFDGTADDRNEIPVVVEFLEHAEEPAAFQIAEGGAVSASRQEVQSAVDTVSIEATAAGLPEPTIVADSESLADGWVAADGANTITSVTLEMNSAANQIEAYANEINVATDLTRQPMLVALQRLRESLNKLAEAVIFAQPRIVDTSVRVTTSLLQFCAERYGGDLAVQRYGEILELNRVNDPLQIRAGTVLRVPEE